MPQVIIFLDDKEDEIVRNYSSEHNISKHDAIKELIKKGQKEVKEMGRKKGGKNKPKQEQKKDALTEIMSKTNDELESAMKDSSGLIR